MRRFSGFLLLAALTACCVLRVDGQELPSPADHCEIDTRLTLPSMVQTPPMGWNSWDCFARQ